MAVMAVSGDFFLKILDHEVQEYLGDIHPCCQVFKAKYFQGGTGLAAPVTLKIIRNGKKVAEDFKQLWEEAAESVICSGPTPKEFLNVHREDVDGIEVIVPVNYFYHHSLLCIQMKYFPHGSLRHLLVKHNPDNTLPEHCVGVILKEVLRGLLYIHGEGKIHKKLHAGNIFIADDPSLKIQLGYRGSTYFHAPKADPEIRIFQRSLESHLFKFMCPASTQLENNWAKWSTVYEPCPGAKVTAASDIFNLGLMALELALGPFCTDKDQTVNKENMRAVLTELRENENVELPTVHGLLIGPEELPAVHQDEEPEQFSTAFVKVVKWCLRLDPQERPTAEELVQDPFFEVDKESGLQFLEQYLKNKKED